VEDKDRDLLAEWLKLGREVLKRYYPASPLATLVIPMGEGLPDTILCVTPLQQTSQTPTPPPS
jgi:hypothetical protein